MKRIVRLTESDLTRIVKRTIREMNHDIDDSVRKDDDDFKGYKDQIISYLNDNGIYPESDNDIRDGLWELRNQGEGLATAYIRRIN